MAGIGLGARAKPASAAPAYGKTGMDSSKSKRALVSGGATLLGVGDGTFGGAYPAGSYPSPPWKSWRTRVGSLGDFHADGKLHLLVLSDDEAVCVPLYVLPGNGEGSFGTQ